MRLKTSSTPRTQVRRLVECVRQHTRALENVKRKKSSKDDFSESSEYGGFSRGRRQNSEKLQKKTPPRVSHRRVNAPADTVYLLNSELHLPVARPVRPTRVEGSVSIGRTPPPIEKGSYYKIGCYERDLVSQVVTSSPTASFNKASRFFGYFNAKDRHFSFALRCLCITGYTRSALRSLLRIADIRVREQYFLYRRCMRSYIALRFTPEVRRAASLMQCGLSDEALWCSPGETWF